MTHKKVIIVGAGMAGVKTAVDLVAGGVEDSMILEARDRAGGRLHTVETGTGRKYDLGALWFHDSLHNPLFDKAVELGNIEYYFDDGKAQFFSKDRNNIEPWEFQGITEEVIAYSQLQYQLNPEKADVSMEELGQEYLASTEKYSSNQRANYGVGMMRCWAELWHGVIWSNLSAKYCFSDGGHLGRNVFVKSGYTSVFNNELMQLPARYRRDNIKYGTQVTSIDYSDGCIVKLKTRNGQQYSCDYLVVTIPFSLLQIENRADPAHVEWTPALPSSFQTTLQNASFGSLGKVIFEFDHCFWPQDVDRFYAISTETPADNCNEFKAWDFPVIFLNYQAISNRPALLALIQDPLSSYIERLDTLEKSANIWNIFAPLVAQLSQIQNVPVPNNIYHTTWNNEIFTRGSYAAPIYGLNDPDEIISLLAHGLNHRIKFAGAETIGSTANGCAHGAWFSGQREAKYILGHINKPKI